MGLTSNTMKKQLYLIEKKKAEKKRVPLTNTIVVRLHDVRQAKFIIVDFDPTVTTSTRDAGSFIFQL